MINCEECRLLFPNLCTYNRHQFSHSKDVNYKFKCKYPECLSILSNYYSFKNHVSQLHANFDKEQYPCSYVNCLLIFINERDLQNHYQWHIDNLSDIITCGICVNNPTKFKSKESLKAHISRHHTNLYGEHLITSYCDSNLKNSNNDCSEINFQCSDRFSNIFLFDDHTHKSNEVRSNNTSNQLEKSSFSVNKNESLVTTKTRVSDKKLSENQSLIDVAQIFSSLYVNMTVKHFASEFAIQDIVRSIGSGTTICQQQFFELISNSNLSENDKNLVLKLFKQSFQGINNTHNLKDGVFRSAFTRNSFYRNNDKYIKPVKTYYRDKHNNDSLTQHYVYVPILETIKLMMNDSHVYNLCFNFKHQQNKNVLYDLRDGNAVKKSPFFNNINENDEEKKKYKLFYMKTVLDFAILYERSQKNIKL